MSDLIGPGPDNYGEGYLDNAPEDPRAIKVIANLQSRLTAAETRIKELESTVDRMSNFNCNLNDTLRSRGYGHTAGKHTEERFITFVHAYDNLRAELDKLKGKS